MKAIEIKYLTLEMNIFEFYSQAHTFIKIRSIGKKEMKQSYQRTNDAASSIYERNFFTLL